MKKIDVPSLLRGGKNIIGTLQGALQEQAAEEKRLLAQTSGWREVISRLVSETPVEMNLN